MRCSLAISRSWPDLPCSSSRSPFWLRSGRRTAHRTSRRLTSQRLTSRQRNHRRSLNKTIRQLTAAVARTFSRSQPRDPRAEARGQHKAGNTLRPRRVVVVWVIRDEREPTLWRSRRYRRIPRSAASAEESQSPWELSRDETAVSEAFSRTQRQPRLSPLFSLPKGGFSRDV